MGSPDAHFPRTDKEQCTHWHLICCRDNSFGVSDQHCCLPLLLHTCNYLSKTPVFLNDSVGLGRGWSRGGGPLLCGNWGSSCLDHVKDGNLITRCFLFVFNWHITSTNVHYKRRLTEPRAFRLEETGPAWCPPLPFTSARPEEAAPARVLMSSVLHLLLDLAYLCHLGSLGSVLGSSELGPQRTGKPTAILETRGAGGG